MSRTSKTQPSTRERVLDTCRSLFNERGPGAVTTAEIAATVGINEGNLYYYFKKKEQIVLALFDQFEAALGELAQRQLANLERSTAGEDNILDFFKVVWEWRFFYRDAPTLYQLAPGLRERNKALADSSHEASRRIVQHLVEQGRLAVPAQEVERLVVNTWIVCTFWIEYLQVTRGVTRITRKHLDDGYEQVRALYRPYAPAVGAPPKARAR
ncbi:MAG: TetR/AcrR family transcriptional regulator [Rhizobacter sp.]|nr:TetR/AcrR family transcriptional regulator [Rhizobacter sp.]